MPLRNLPKMHSELLSVAEPWKSNCHYFNNVRISLTALMKMTEHVRSGGDVEVMGLLLGKHSSSTFTVNDSLILPVLGTETRVNAQEDAYEFMVNYMELQKEAKSDSVIGWYHSHPGYGCWLSGIDVATQRLHQEHLDPFIAIVIDPKRTASNQGKVEIGAFRTLPKDSHPKSSIKPPNLLGNSSLTDKLQDFGAHSSEYYQLDIEYFCSLSEQKFIMQNFSQLQISDLLLLNTDSIQPDNEPILKDLQSLLDQLTYLNGILCQEEYSGITTFKRLRNTTASISTKLQQCQCSLQTIKKAKEFIDSNGHQEPTTSDKQ